MLSVLLYLIIPSQSSDATHIFNNQDECGYFIYDSTPIPFNMCMHMQSEQTRSLRSVMYACNNNIVSYNEYDTINCTGNIHNTNYFNSSLTTVYNCDATESSNKKHCNVATVDIWNNPYCFDEPYYQLLYVINVCFSIYNSYSVHFGCNDNGLIQQDIYNNLNCNGNPLIMNGSNNDYNPMATNNSNPCFLISCNNKTYISYDPSNDNNNNHHNPPSFWNNPRSEELAFIIAAGTALFLFWSCYCYRTNCRKSTNNNGDNEQENNVKSDKYDELMEEKQNENVVISTAMTTMTDTKNVTLLQPDVQHQDIQ